MITIREMSAKDEPALAALFLQCRRHTFFWVQKDFFSLSDFKKEIEGEWVIVAEQNSKIVGFASIWVQDNFLHHLYVSPNAQGKGIGPQLLEACFRGKLKKPARLKCVIRNTKACQFYEHLGWKIEMTNPEGSIGLSYTYVLKAD